jgi:acyl-CoA dehydrogenase
LLGTTVCAGLLAKGALAVDDRDPHDAAKRAGARFFAEQILPTVAGLMPAITADADVLFALDVTQLQTH